MKEPPAPSIDELLLNRPIQNSPSYRRRRPPKRQKASLYSSLTRQEDEYDSQDYDDESSASGEGYNNDAYESVTLRPMKDMHLDIHLGVAPLQGYDDEEDEEDDDDDESYYDEDGRYHSSPEEAEGYMTGGNIHGDYQDSIKYTGNQFHSPHGQLEVGHAHYGGYQGIPNYSAAGGDLQDYHHQGHNHGHHNHGGHGNNFEYHGPYKLRVWKWTDKHGSTHESWVIHRYK